MWVKNNWLSNSSAGDNGIYVGKQVCVFLEQTVYSMATFPFPQLAELREKYTYNITPFPAAVKSIGRCVT